MSKLFVYGVNAQCPRDILEGEFARCGEVTDVYITEKGYAFVTMAGGRGGGDRGGFSGGRGGGQSWN